jgi:hypothetical protein
MIDPPDQVIDLVSDDDEMKLHHHHRRPGARTMMTGSG